MNNSQTNFELLFDIFPQELDDVIQDHLVHSKPNEVIKYFNLHYRVHGFQAHEIVTRINELADLKTI